ncbi:MAG TPA: alpha/beta hydrolase [Longimicrobiales bacterium]|nr:alpha/beta hydrolase [Longimicrobiales bacterium]
MGPEVEMVLIHGAGLDTYIWDGVASRLRRPTRPVSFPNRGRGDGANRGLTLRDYTTAVRAQVEEAEGPMVLVAHSIGGCVALELADRLGDRVVGIIGVSAAFPERGQSFISSLPVPQRWVLPLLMRVFGTRPPAKAIQQSLCADLPPERSREVVDRFTPEARALYKAKVEYESLPAPRWYVKLTRDRDFPPYVQDAMAANLQATEVIEMDTAHLPMMSHPEELTGILEDFARHVENA